MGPIISKYWFEGNLLNIVGLRVKKTFIVVGGNMLMQQIYRAVSELFWHRDPASIKSRARKVPLKGEKMQRKRKGCSRSRAEQPPFSSTSPSLTWHRKPLAHCTKDHEAPHRQHDLHIFPPITAWRTPAKCQEARQVERRKRIKKRTAEMMARIQS